MNPSVRNVAIGAGKFLLSLLWLTVSAQAQFAGPFGRSQAYGLVALIPGLIAIWYPGLTLRDRGLVAAIGFAAGAGVLMLAYFAATSVDSIRSAALSYGYISTFSWMVAAFAGVWMARRATPGQRRFLQRFGL